MYSLEPESYYYADRDITPHSYSKKVASDTNKHTHRMMGMIIQYKAQAYELSRPTVMPNSSFLLCKAISHQHDGCDRTPAVQLRELESSAGMLASITCMLTFSAADELPSKPFSPPGSLVHTLVQAAGRWCTYCYMAGHLT